MLAKILLSCPMCLTNISLFFKIKQMRKLKNYKICPRCGNKCLINQEKCEECHLIFSRMQYASNKAAKKKIRKFDKDFVIYTNQYPSDISRIKLVLYTIFLGLFGVHYYYVGKYIKGALMSTSFIYLVFCTVFNEQVLLYFSEYAFVPIGIAAFAWIVSLVLVLTKKFKVPVIVEIPDVEIENSKKELEALKEEIKTEKKKIKNQKSETKDLEDKKEEEK